MATTPQARDFFEEAIYDGMRWFKTFGIILAGVFLLMAAGIGVFLFISSRVIDVPEPMTTDVPLENYSTSNIETFVCIHAGADDCSNYADAQQYLILATENHDLTYTPLHDTDPGTDTGEGTKAVQLTDSTSDEDWAAVAAAVTRDGQVTLDNWGLTGPSNESDSLPFTAGSGDDTVTGQMQFDTTSGRVYLTAITYGE